MNARLVILCAVVALAGCREERAALPDPVAITAEAAGFYCQMALLEHDGPKGQIHLDGMPAPLFFSQVKDAVAYLHMPEQSHAVVATYVQEMSTGTWAEPGPWVEVSEAVYVVGSEMMGGMGAPEFVPFATRAAAEAFAARHGGEIRAFDAITAQDVLGAPEAGTQAAQGEDDIAARLNALTSYKGQ
ncbi:nitrous oxide reductase accessory protein NosL [Celeribacter sp.]|uniref:nitrous oxide reductase accessory protein NosL n=1 Tax=Celeribacter sp. TaxID=1890673 RepID=UPI003A8E9B5B